MTYILLRFYCKTTGGIKKFVIRKSSAYYGLKFENAFSTIHYMKQNAILSS